MMDKRTGHRIDDEATHIRQSVADILGTPVGSRIMRRPYGSLIPSLIDQPGNPATRLRLMAATVMALITWEPRISVQRAGIEIGIDGKAVVDLEAVRRAGPRSGEALNLSIPVA